MRRCCTCLLFLLLLLLCAFPVFAENTDQIVQSVEPDASTRVELLLRDGAYIVRLTEHIGSAKETVTENTSLLAGRSAEETPLLLTQDRTFYVYTSASGSDCLTFVKTSSGYLLYDMSMTKVGEQFLFRFGGANYGTFDFIFSDGGRYDGQPEYDIPCEPFSFAQTDPQSIYAACVSYRQHIEQGEPVETYAQVHSGDLPQAQVIDFPKGQTWPAYFGPGPDYLAAADAPDYLTSEYARESLSALFETKGLVSTDNWIQVFGRMGDWIMVQYPLADGTRCIAWISAEALPQDAEVPELTLMYAPRWSNNDQAAYNGSYALGTLLPYWMEDSQIVYTIATYGPWSYVEIPFVDGVPVWLFIDTLGSHG